MTDEANPSGEKQTDSKSNEGAIDGPLWSGLGSIVASIWAIAFIVLGLVFLNNAQSLIHKDENPSIIFLYTVLGIATFLFGTGSQLAARFEGKQAFGGALAVTLVGGSAGLAFLTAYGLLIMQKDIRTVFSPSETVQRVRIEFCSKKSYECIYGSGADNEDRKQLSNFLAENRNRLYLQNKLGEAMYQIPFFKARKDALDSSYSIDFLVIRHIPAKPTDPFYNISLALSEPQEQERWSLSSVSFPYHCSFRSVPERSNMFEKNADKEPKPSDVACEETESKTIDKSGHRLCIDASGNIIIFDKLDELNTCKIYPKNVLINADKIPEYTFVYLVETIKVPANSK